MAGKKGWKIAMKLSDHSLAEDLFHTIPVLHDQLVKPFESMFREELSPMQFYTLIALHRNHCMTMTELACHFGISKQQMTKIINNLVDLEIVCRIPDPADRRLVKIRPTKKAFSYIQKYQEEICRQILCSLHQLDERDLQDLSDALGVIYTILPKLSFQNRMEEEKDHLLETAQKIPSA